METMRHGSAPPHTPHDHDLPDLAHQVVALQWRQPPARTTLEEFYHELMQLMQRLWPRRQATERAQDAALRPYIPRVQLRHLPPVERGYQCA